MVVTSCRAFRNHGWRTEPSHVVGNTQLPLIWPSGGAFGRDGIACTGPAATTGIPANSRVTNARERLSPETSSFQRHCSAAQAKRTRHRVPAA